MTKQEFLTELRKKLSVLPQHDIEERLTFYAEMIDDYKDNGLSEEDAIAKIGSIDEIASQILPKNSLSEPEKTQQIPPKSALSELEKAKSENTLKILGIILIILGSPIWFSLLIALLCIIFSAVIVALSLIFSAIVIVGCSIYGIFYALTLTFKGNTLIGIAILGLCMALVGLSILLFLGLKISIKGIKNISQTLTIKIKTKLMEMKKSNE